MASHAEGDARTERRHGKRAAAVESAVALPAPRLRRDDEFAGSCPSALAFHAISLTKLPRALVGGDAPTRRKT